MPGFFYVSFMNTISFQGIEGSFHHEVAAGYFGQDQRWLGRDRFSEVFDDVATGTAKYGVIAIENSNVGTIVANLDLFNQAQVHIVAEVYLSVQQCLLIHPEATLEDIIEVRSHPMALDQCRAYLREKPSWTRVEVADTAGAAKWVMDHSASHIAAIGSALAAAVYGMKIAAHSIQQDTTNQTRFWVIAKAGSTHTEKTGQPLHKVSGLDPSALKATISFETSHETGALADALQAIKSNGWNLTKIESRPVPDISWRYRFYCDVELGSTVDTHQKDALADFESSLQSLEQARAMESSRVLGLYQVYYF